jgi:hypothetical protein
MNLSLEEQLSKAVSLAKWLVEKKHTKSSVAYLIACHKYKLPPVTGRELVRKEYQKVKGIDPNQKTLF